MNGGRRRFQVAGRARAASRRRLWRGADRGARAVGRRRGAGGATTVPIHHVVVILQENHSFDNVLGQLCAKEKPTTCNSRRAA